MSRVILTNLAWDRPDGSNLFKNLNYTFSSEKNGLVGINGIGKSTLAKIISGALSPSTGKVDSKGIIKYFPQNFAQYKSQSIIEVLGLKERYLALKNVINGIGSEEDLLKLDNDWELEKRISNSFNEIGLGKMNVNRNFSSLSGGEQIRSLLASLILNKPDFIILDEPTNHLDHFGREIIYSFISSWKKGMIVISHDRDLLRLMDSITELSILGLKSYGGNYDFYIEQLRIENESALQGVKFAQTELTKSLATERRALKIQEKRIRSSEKAAQKSGIPKILLNKRKGTGEASLKKIKETHEKKVEQSKNQLSDAKAKLRISKQIKIDITKKITMKRKTIVLAENINYSFDRKSFLWEKNISLIITGNERISIKGKNGSGKTTLLKLIAKELFPSNGKLYVGAEKIGMLDQQVSILNDNLNLLENLRSACKKFLPEHDLRIRLGRVQFYKDDVFKKAGLLSGGERMRLGIACLLASENEPELIVLDEPTNNLDLESINELTSSLNNFKGALIVVSHDRQFLTEIGIHRELDLDMHN